jgi:hypothetical protein
MKKQSFTMWSLMALFLAATWFPANAESRNPEADALREVLRAKRANESTNDPEWRASLAVALRRYCESVLVQVPRNTPQEDRWVDEELNDLRPDSSNWDQRMARIENSLEHARKSLRNVLSECSSIAGKLIGPKTRSPAAEALLWVRLSRFFSAEEEIWRFAEIVGLDMPINYCRQQEAEFRGGYRLPARPSFVFRDKNDLCYWDYVRNVIIEHAVTPLLEAAQ